MPKIDINLLCLVNGCDNIIYFTTDLSFLLIGSVQDQLLISEREVLGKPNWRVVKLGDSKNYRLKQSNTTTTETNCRQNIFLGHSYPHRPR